MVSANQIIGFNIQSDNSSQPPTQIYLTRIGRIKFEFKNAHTLKKDLNEIDESNAWKMNDCI